MIHPKARRLLPEVLEGNLPESIEARVRGHAQGCARCRRVMRELEAMEGLLRKLPPSLVPLAPSPASDARLAALARWAAEPEPIWRERFGASAVGAFAVAAVLALFLLTSTWAPLVGNPSGAMALAAVVPDANYAPIGWSGWK